MEHYRTDASCFTASLTSEVRTFAEALAFCKANGGVLAAPTTTQALDALPPVYRYSGVRPFIGFPANVMLTSGHWRTYTGSTCDSPQGAAWMPIGSGLSRTQGK